MSFRAQILAVALASFFITVCTGEFTTNAPPSMITPAPRVVKRQLYDAYFQNDFIGYYLAGDTYLPSFCAGNLYKETSLSKSDNYFGGCTSSSTFSVYTSCVGSWAYGVGRSTSRIGTGLTRTTTWSTSKSCPVSCISNYVVYTSDGPSTSYFVNCGSTTDTLYRMRSTSLNYDILMTTRPFSPTDAAITPADTGTTATVTMTNGAPVPTTNALPNSDKGPPIGPIVGGTIGGAALIVAVVAGVWFCLQKRRKDQDKPEAYATTHHQSLPPAMPPQPYFYYSGSDKISVPANNYPQQQQWVPGPGVSPTTTPPPVPSYIQQITQQPAPQSARQSQTYQQPQMHILQPQSLDPLVANSQNQQPQVQDPPIQHVDALGQPNQNPDKDSNFQKYST